MDQRRRLAVDDEIGTKSWGAKRQTHALSGQPFPLNISIEIN